MRRTVSIELGAKVRLLDLPPRLDKFKLLLVQTGTVTDRTELFGTLVFVVEFPLGEFLLFEQEIWFKFPRKLDA